jgi:hypothetical protein
MSTKCFPLIRGRVMRATRLDNCGRIKSTGSSAVTTDGFVSVALTANYVETEGIAVQNAGGKQCVTEPSTSRFSHFGVAVTFCQVDPELYSLMTAQPVVYDSAGQAVGFQVNSDVDSADANFGLEVWSGAGSTDACEEGAEGQFGYTLLPYISGGVIGDFTIENAAVTFTVTNAITKDGTAWGVGPYDVVPAAGGVASPLLTALGTKNHLHVQYTTIEPPEPACEIVASGPKSTGATAGIPATLTPADSYPPPTFASLTTTHTLTATPATAWTTGQHVVLGDGSHAFWNGTAWVAGNAP